jgi:hypothetical protein
MDQRNNGAALDTALTDQWSAYLRKQQQTTADPVEVVLPSGMKVRARRPNLLLLLRTGRIPDVISPRVEQLVKIAQGGGEEAVKADIQREQQENPAKFQATWRNLLEVVWCEAVAEPRFTFDPDRNPDALPVFGVSDLDAEYLFMFAQGVDETVSTFLDRRNREAASVGNRPAGATLRTGPGTPVGDQSADG